MSQIYKTGTGGGGAGAVTSFDVDAHTAPGTDPVLPTAGGLVTVTGGQVAAGTTVNVIRTDSLAANTYTIEVQRSQAVASSTVGDNGVSHFNSAQFTVDANGFVTITGSIAPNYTLVTTAASPYTVLSTDVYIATDSTAGPITLLFPNAPTQFRQWTIKDRAGTDAVSPVSVTTVGGAVLIDGLTTYTMNSNYQAIQLLFNGTFYEVS